ncbi:hypothetical protein EBR66_04490 [bacterium]|nr:hypothetical protein [bacterium]
MTKRRLPIEERNPDGTGTFDDSILKGQASTVGWLGVPSTRWPLYALTVAVAFIFLAPSLLGIK